MGWPYFSLRNVIFQGWSWGLSPSLVSRGLRIDPRILKYDGIWKFLGHWVIPDVAYFLRMVGQNPIIIKVDLLKK